MLFLNNATYADDPGMPTLNDIDGACHWNLWKVRMQPFNELADGDTIVLVDSWRGGGRLTWEIQSSGVLAAPYRSKHAAVRMISNAVGLPAPQVAAHPYTKDHPDSGYVLAFSYRPVRRIARPKPKDLRLRQHGWLKVDDPRILKRWACPSV